ncbi:MAG TPA: hypothetical protein VLT47_11195 [Anaeromyxobacteraceae bacterium]|nr:hypothetical protein [Anaeromyxobacteraceae bacterium]
MSAAISEAELLRTHWQSLLTEVEAAIAHRRAVDQGGQTAGSGGRLGNAMPSVLLHLQQCCRHALAVPRGDA